MSEKSSVAALPPDEGMAERQERRPVSLHGFAMRADGSTSEVRLLDLSYEGCGIETRVEFSAGERLKLSVLRRGAIDATVRWCEAGRAGLVFKSEEPKEKPHWPRRYTRTAITAEVSMRRLGKLNYRVRVFDICPDGCKVELVDRPRLEEHVLVKLDGLEVLEAEVCWIDGTSAGLCFEKSIHPAVFDLMLERMTRGA